MIAQSGLSFGKSGSYKTSEMRWLARWVYATTGKKTRLISSDGGGWGPLKVEVDAGIIEPFHVSSDKDPLGVWRKLSKGYWPSVLEHNGQALLAAPTAETWKNVGAIVVEGLTSIAAIIMLDHLSKQRIVSYEDRLVTYEEEISVLRGLISGKPDIVREAEKFSFPNRSHYGAVQQQIKQIVFSFENLPVEYVWFTALETKGEDRDTKRTIIGPHVLGSAVTFEAYSWFGTTFHHDFVPRFNDDGSPTGLYDVRVYFVPHQDSETGLPIPCKSRAAPELLREMVKRVGENGSYAPPAGSYTEFGGLGKYLQTLENLQSQGATMLTSWMDKERQARAHNKVSDNSTTSQAKEPPK